MHMMRRLRYIENAESTKKGDRTDEAPKQTKAVVEEAGPV